MGLSEFILRLKCSFKDSFERDTNFNTNLAKVLLLEDASKKRRAALSHALCCIMKDSIARPQTDVVHACFLRRINHEIVAGVWVMVFVAQDAFVEGLIVVLSIKVPQEAVLGGVFDPLIFDCSWFNKLNEKFKCAALVEHFFEATLVAVA